MVESDTWEERENLGNAKEAIKEFEKEYRWDIEDIRKQEREKEHLEEKNCKEDLWQRNYLDRQIRNTTRNIGEG